MPEDIKLSSCSTLLSVQFILLINVKMPTINGIFKFHEQDKIKCDFDDLQLKISLILAILIFTRNI